MVINRFQCFGLVVVLLGLVNFRQIEAAIFDKSYITSLMPMQYSKLHCFNWDEVNSRIQCLFSKILVPILGQCREQFPHFNEQQVKACAHNRAAVTERECMERHRAPYDYTQVCLIKRLRINAKVVSFARFKRAIMRSVKTEKKIDRIDKSISLCVRARDWYYCSLTRLAQGPCPELSKVIDKLVLSLSNDTYVPYNLLVNETLIENYILIHSKNDLKCVK